MENLLGLYRYIDLVLSWSPFVKGDMYYLPSVLGEFGVSAGMAITNHFLE